MIVTPTMMTGTCHLRARDAGPLLGGVQLSGKLYIRHAIVRVFPCAMTTRRVNVSTNNHMYTYVNASLVVVGVTECVKTKKYEPEKFFRLPVV